LDRYLEIRQKHSTISATSLPPTPIPPFASRRTTTIEKAFVVVLSISNQQGISLWAVQQAA